MPARDPIEAAAFAVDSADRARQRALRYLNVFRLILGGLFLVAGEEFGLGSESPGLYLAAVGEGSWDGEAVFFETADEAYDYLMGELRDGDRVLVKSSNSAGLRHLGDRLGESFS